ncbi:MAG: hypothetical protein ACTS7I_03190 [Candidatus Hodgkinia cicadicola]
MIENKIDMFLVETVFDTLNAKAAIAAFYSPLSVFFGNDDFF